jgi:hypothetical protein
MPPITSLPPGYRRHAVLNPFNRRRSWIGLATVGLILIGAVMVLMIQVLTLRRSLQADWLERAVRDAALAPEPGLPALLLQAVVLVVAFYGIIVLHEAIHGAFFWLFTRRRPRFGFRDRAAFAAADPGVFLTRNQYLAATHAPLVVITGAGLALLLVLPPGAAALVGFLMIANAAGAPSDLRVAAWLFLQPRGALVRDNGAISVFVPAAERPVPAAAAPAADTTISMVRANVAVGGVSVATAAVLVAPFVLLWGADELWRGMDAIFRLQVLIPATIAGVVVHELLHMAGYLAGGAPRGTLHFGINLRVLSPYAGCRHPLSAMAYRRAVLLPALVLGVAPAAFALASGAGWLLVWAYLMLVVSAGDFAALWAMRAVDADALVLDHPTRVGCSVVPAAAVEQTPA